MNSELEQERLQSAKLCRENETLRALNIECSRLSSERSAKLTEMESVLEWSSENVLVMLTNHGHDEWVARVKGEPYTGPNLYDALYSAWKEREVKS